MLRADGGIKMRKVTTQLAALALLLVSGSAFAWPCDFMTGGGFIFFNGNKANFGVGGGCKHGSPDWGHLEYIDHGLGVNIHATSITGYFEESTGTNAHGQPGVNDQFDIRVRNQLGVIVYDTTTQCFPHFLGSTAPCAPGNGGGGNIQLHKPNPSTSGFFGGSCPAL